MFKEQLSLKNKVSTITGIMLFKILILLSMFPVYGSIKNDSTKSIKWYNYSDISSLLHEKDGNECKPVLICFYTNWSGNSRKFLNNLINSDINMDLQSGFIMIKVDGAGEDGELLCRKENIRVFPTIKVLDYRGRVVGDVHPSEMSGL